VNRPRSPAASPCFSPPQHWLTSVPGSFSEKQLRVKRTLSKVAYDEDEATIRPTTATSIYPDVGTDSEGEGRNRYHTKKELSAAEILLELRAADNGLHRTKRTRRSSWY
jgi:hypothetical protein